MSKKKIFIIILNYNGCKNTLECLHSFETLRHPQGHELIPVIVDNASIDDSVKTFKEEFPQIKLIENKINTGYAGGNNTGITYALISGADYIVILNNDTLFERSSVLEMLESIVTYRADVVCPKIYFEKGFEYHSDRYQKKDLGKVFWFAGAVMDWGNVIASHRGVDEVDIGQYDDKLNIEFITGACFMVKRVVFEKLKGFDETYFLYYEDADLSMKMNKSGFKMMLAPKSIIYHKNAGSTGGSGSGLQDYYITRNRLLFGLRYASTRAKFALLRESMRLFVSGRKWQKKGVADFYLHKLGKGTYPLDKK